MASPPGPISSVTHSARTGGSRADDRRCGQPRSHRPGATLTLSVRPGVLEAGDDGRGVEEDELPRLFERFFRSDRARASRGTGLGLAIVKHVVVSAGGAVEASGGPGRGLRVICSFPAP